MSSTYTYMNYEMQVGAQSNYSHFITINPSIPIVNRI